MKLSNGTINYKTHKEKCHQQHSESRRRERHYFDCMLSSEIGRESNPIVHRLEALYGSKKRIGSNLRQDDFELYDRISKIANSKNMGIKAYLQKIGYVYGESFSVY